MIKRRLLTILSWESVRFSSYMGIQARDFSDCCFSGVSLYQNTVMGPGMVKRRFPRHEPSTLAFRRLHSGIQIRFLTTRTIVLLILKYGDCPDSMAGV